MNSINNYTLQFTNDSDKTPVSKPKLSILKKVMDVERKIFDNLKNEPHPRSTVLK